MLVPNGMAAFQSGGVGGVGGVRDDEVCLSWPRLVFWERVFGKVHIQCPHSYFLLICNIYHNYCVYYYIINHMIIIM